MKVTKFRVARPTTKLSALREFYVDGLGLVDRGTFEAHAGYDGQLLGTTDDNYEIEFTQREGDSACASPSQDALLVFYLENATAVSSAEARLKALGFPAVDPQNPYWVGKSLTFEDPDGWRVVLFDNEALASRKSST